MGNEASLPHPRDDDFETNKYTRFWPFALGFDFGFGIDQAY